MKVYIRRWKAEQKGYVQEGPYMIDAYSGIAFTQGEESSVVASVIQQSRARNIFLHASEPNALVVYVEDVERKEIAYDCQKNDIDAPHFLDCPNRRKDNA